MQAMPVSKHQAAPPDSVFDPAQLLAQKAECHQRASEKFSPAASSFAASAADTAAAMSSTLRKASHTLHESVSQVSSLSHACMLVPLQLLQVLQSALSQLAFSWHNVHDQLQMLSSRSQVYNFGVLCLCTSVQ